MAAVISHYTYMILYIQGVYFFIYKLSHDSHRLLFTEEASKIVCVSQFPAPCHKTSVQVFMGCLASDDQ